MNNGLICVSVCAETADEMMVKIKRAEEFADVIEVRFDCLKSDEVASGLDGVRLSKIPLVTFRSVDQGGKRRISEEEREEFWANVDPSFWVDVEEDAVGLVDSSEMSIVSNHDFSGAPTDMGQVYARLSERGADAIKIAVTAEDITGAIPVWKLLEQAKFENKKIIPIAMGEAGKWTRILGFAHGAFLTYASLDAGDETAPGQITAKDMVEIYRVKELDLDTKVFGVLGDPIGQSLSTYMHNPAFVSAGVNAVFIPFVVKDIAAFMARMVKTATREVELNFGGFSVTMPHKQSIISHLDAIDPTAEKIGAVNTVKVEADGNLTGYNTDAHGFITPLMAKFGGIRAARVAVFGAGGAARACVYALRQEGANVTVFARDSTKGEAFGAEFDVKYGPISKFKDRSSKIGTDFEILVDATSLGMKGPLENDSLFDAEQLDGLKFVYDLVTKTSDTPIVREAKKAGVPAIGGLEMLIAQGARQFEIWTGRPAPAQLMRDSLVARMPK